MLKTEVYKKKIANLDELKQRITDVIAGIRQYMCVNTVNATLERFVKCAENSGEKVEALNYSHLLNEVCHIMLIIVLLIDL